MQGPKTPIPCESSRYQSYPFSNHLHLSRLLLAGDVCKLQGGGEALLELLGLVGVLKNQGVEVLLASDLELDVVGLLVLLDPGGC